ncbi:adenosine deaminase [Mesorhizobium sp. J428]|uniref:adenosine deaminase n=1 Tax=Mesorhizobium sp. J428 TaxID=2898440 RepID=UPI002150BCD0|nr:adenosine deaminase [Mesorhizobium sp. J428]MCR5856236.1 adenosine deaminase [Mesorhizobium sp. J428]
MDFKSLPKAEIHIHLEGCFSTETIVELARENGTPLPRPEDRLLEFQGLADFLEFLDFICGLSRTKDQLAKSAYAFSRRMADSGVGYADVIVNPTHWSSWRGDLSGLVEGLDEGFRAAEADGLTPAGLCVSLLRQQSSAEAVELVEELLRLKHPRVVALSVDGNEAASGRTGEKFAEAFQLAGRGGLKRTAHAGESSGPEGVRDAIFLLGADRIDHGVRAIEDSELVDILADRQIALGICPSSNLVLGLYKTLGEHPIDLLRRAGVPVSVNTDDPALLRTDLAAEYARTADTFAWGKETCTAVAETSIRASFAPDGLKASLLEALATW